jgi:hypothetical protein
MDLMVLWIAKKRFVISPVGPLAHGRPVDYWLTIALLCRRSRVMNRHARINRRKRITSTMKKTKITPDTKTAAVAELGTPVAPKKATSKRDARSGKDAPKANIGAKKAAPKKAATPDSKKPAPPATEAREGSKKATILELLRRPKGATLTEIAKVTHWQNHSIRGFLSGTLRKKMGLTVESTKNQAGDRTYRLGK